MNTAHKYLFVLRASAIVVIKRIKDGIPEITIKTITIMGMMS